MRMRFPRQGWLALLAICGHAASAQSGPVAGASVPSASAASVTASRDAQSFQGFTEPYRFCTISSEIAARITAVRINEGGRARKGDTILVLDAGEAFLEAERSRIIAESDAELTAAKLKSEMAKRDLAATRLVFDSTRSVSQEEIWKKQLESDLAKTEVDRLTMAKQKAALEYKIALENLERHFVIAPYDGIVAQRFLNEGETCKPEEPLIKFVDVAHCRFVTYLPVRLTQGLAKGSRISLSVGEPKKPFIRSGVIDFISPVVDQASGLRTTKVVFANSDGSIQPGVPGFMQLEK
jgi:RND family efflux transporter MFP subunit